MQRLTSIIFSIFAFITLTTNIHAQQISNIKLKSTRSDSLLFVNYIPNGSDFSLAYSEECYWWSNQESFAILSLKGKQWTAWQYYRKWRSSGDVFSNKGVKKEKHFKKAKELDAIKVEQLFDSLANQGFWQLAQDSLNQQRRKTIHPPNGKPYTVNTSISDAVGYRFQVEAKQGGEKVISSYAPEYFISEFPDMSERKKFLIARNIFIRWWKQNCH